MPCSSKFTCWDIVRKPPFERLTKMLLKIRVSMTLSPNSALSNVVRKNKYKINYGHNIVVVSITIFLYFLQILPALLH